MFIVNVHFFDSKEEDNSESLFYDVLSLSVFSLPSPLIFPSSICSRIKWVVNEKRNGLTPFHSFLCLWSQAQDDVQEGEESQGIKKKEEWSRDDEEDDEKDHERDKSIRVQVYVTLFLESFFFFFFFSFFLNSEKEKKMEKNRWRKRDLDAGLCLKWALFSLEEQLSHDIFSYRSSSYGLQFSQWTELNDEWQGHIIAWSRQETKWNFMNAFESSSSYSFSRHEESRMT